MELEVGWLEASVKGLRKSVSRYCKSRHEEERRGGFGEVASHSRRWNCTIEWIMSTESRVGGPSLRIIAVNDVYTLENLPCLRSLVEHHTRTNPADALMVTLAGDFVAPSILSSLDNGQGMVDCMNAVGFTHVIFGNHEDDIALSELRLRIGELHATWLDTNVRDFLPALPAYQVLEFGPEGGRRVRVGLVGVVMTDPTVYRRKPFGGTEILPANEAARAEAWRLLRDERCISVIPLTHQPVDEDRELARAQNPAFPVIIGGHEHEVLLEQVSGTWIVKAGADAVEAVVIDVTWAAEETATGAPEIPMVTVHLEAVAHYPENVELRARVDMHMKRVRDLEAATLLRLAPGQSLSSVGMRCRQTTMGTLVCSRVRDALDAEVCVFNAGGIRGAREYKDRVTYGDLKAEVPFDNEVVVATLPGSLLREAIVASRAHAPAESGGFLQVDDRTTVDPTTHVVSVIAGVPFAEDREYRVAIVRNLFDGLDHIEPLIRFARENPDKIPPALSGREVKILLVDAFSLALWKELGGFDVIDANHDGVVTNDEIAVAVSRFAAEPLSPLTADLVIHALDADHDHAISRAEADAVNALKKRS